MAAKPKSKSRSRPGPLEPFAFRVPVFCELHGISVAQFYFLQQRGQGPEVMRVGGRVLVSREAAERWRKRMEKQTAESVALGGG